MKIYGLNRIARSDKYNPNIIRVYEEVLKLDAELEIVAVVSKSLDQKDTANELRRHNFGGRVHVVESTSWTTLFMTELQPGTWSAALNDGLAYIARLPVTQNDLLFSFSDVARLSQKTYNRMKGAILNNDVCVVGIRFPEFTAISYQHPRNTCCLWTLEDVLKHNGFALFTDHLGGQEDYELVRRLRHTGRVHMMIDGQARELQLSPVRAQEAKEALELSSIKQINEIHDRLYGILAESILAQA